MKLKESDTRSSAQIVFDVLPVVSLVLPNMGAGRGQTLGGPLTLGKMLIECGVNLIVK